MAALARLGLADAVVARGDIVRRRRVYDDRGRPLIDFDEAGLWRDVAPPVALHRAELHRILVDGAAGVPIRTGLGVAAIDEAGGRASVRFDDGSIDAFDLVIGADGIHSSIRVGFVGSDSTSSKPRDSVSAWERTSS